MMAGNSPGWAVELIGEYIDLDDFREELKAPFSPWIEDYSTEEVVIPLLRSENWKNLPEKLHVFQDATRIIERLNGEALLIHSDAQPVKLGQVMRFDSKGNRENILFMSTVSLQYTGRNAIVRSRDRGIVATNGPPPPPRESNMQKWFAEAERNDTLADLFSHVNRADNWFDLYKSAELARRIAGGKRALKKVLSSDWKKWELVFRTANCHRHAPDPIKYPWPPSPVGLNEAREFIISIIPRLLT